MVRQASALALARATVVRLWIVFLLLPSSTAFRLPTTVRRRAARWTTPAFPPSAVATTIDDEANDADRDDGGAAVRDEKAAVLRIGAETRNGVRADAAQRRETDALVRAVEARNRVVDPARSAAVDGTWRVRYSTAPPPSNGQLGPLVGMALQTVDLGRGVYANELLVGGDDDGDDAWLSATLLADWDDVGNGSDWVVNFRTLEIRLWGFLPLVKKTFAEGTSRIWTTTYLDDDTRIVRAGPTESEARRLGTSANPKDYFVFYMTKEKKTRNVGVADEKIGLIDVLRDPARFMEDDD